MNQQTIHIVFSQAAHGSLRMALSNLNLQEDLISLPDTFSIGPVSKIDEESELKNRYQWMKDHLSFLFPEDLPEMENQVRQAVLDIRAIPDDRTVVIWTGDNAHEQTGLGFALHLLKDKGNEIKVINTTTGYHQLFVHDDPERFPRKMGGLDPEQLSRIYKEHAGAVVLQMKERERLENEWKKISATQKVLRVWENDSVRNVDADYFDDFILECIQRSQREQGSDIIILMRAIGEVVGHLEEYIGDEYPEYRIRQLIKAGQLEMRESGMYYDVKMNTGNSK
ncbi:DUF1835 domain-containing protein [Bacillus sp. SJS]|uniref:DUF1835 domain-containing protein n=1 Tax=Bacillus sp. SJS TaxID=1423321 RepID=UPI0004DD46F7|nr:DUF1835 domain-containing protein [Bacillus sp. SJS]KZZ83963.1 hypothetical protein AS29_012235 [Bacillus sp. SJS]